MTTETMTVHKALAELKLMDKRIMDAVSEGVYCLANKHSNDKIKGVKKDTYVERMRGSYDRVNDLILRYNALKKAINKSNGVTRVEVAGDTYTVAEAIAMKQHGIAYPTMFLTAMRSQLSDAQKTIDKENGDKLNERADKYVIDMLGGKEKLTSEEGKKAREEYVASQSYELIDPLDINKKISELSDKIAAFEAEVDAALSVSNATTTITIEY